MLKPILMSTSYTGGQQSTSNSPPSSQQTGSKPNKDVKENTNRPKKPAVVQDENQFVQNTNKGRLVIFHFTYDLIILILYSIT